MKKLYLVSGNQEKVKEAQAILGVPIEIANIDLDEIQSMNLKEVAGKKVEEAFKIVKKPVFVEDVCLKIEALEGFPGPLVKFFLQTLGNEKVIELLKNEKNRKIRVESATGYHDGKKAHVFIGGFDGTISKELRGNDGWGFDFFVIPDGYTQTFAEMGFEQKNKISHRKKSLDMLKRFLNSQSNKKDL
jgi:non-canonical purine NTP pyrophosphatase (RdgB/HAM1 family)